MLAKVMLYFAFALVPALQASPAPGPSVTPVPAAADDTPAGLPSPDPHILAKAQEWFVRFQTGKIDRTQLDARTDHMLTQKMIDDEQKTLAALGKPSTWLFFGSQPVQYATGYEFGIQFRKARVLEHIAFDADGKIAGVQFQVFPY